MAVLNISGYKFAPLDRLPEHRVRLLNVAREAQLRGTILLGEEGINLFVAGTPAGVRSLLEAVRAIPGFAGFETKDSLSATQPFQRMLVKVKREIIAFGVPGIDPARHPAPRIGARDLCAWLDSDQPPTLLDTRNRYEIAAGTFHGAIDPGIDHFRDFPAAVSKLPDALKSRPVVTFCTGGIRCEKAAPLLQREGFAEVYQLDGGILGYFAACGARHFKGQCFVFDERGAVGPSPAAAPAADPG